MDDPSLRAKAGHDDRVVYIGPRDPQDVIWSSCEHVESIAYLPQGWPYGPVAGVAARTHRGAR
jgi:hypothetical protein